MPHDTPLISTIVVALALAWAFGALAHRLKAPPLVGYLLAGIAIGPFTPGFVADQGLANELSEIGVILLMFGVGLHFSLDDLLSVQRDRDPRRRGADRVCDRARHELRLVARLADRRRHRVRPRALGRQHRGAAARPAGTPPDRDRARSHRGRLADRRGPRDGAGAGAAPARWRRIFKGDAARASRRSPGRSSSRSAKSRPSSP